MKILFLVTCANVSRLPLLWSTLSSLYSSLDVGKWYCQDVEVLVAFNDINEEAFKAPNSGQGISTWSTVFETIGVGFSVRYFDRSLSPPQMWIKVLQSLNQDVWFVSVDDDTIWHNTPALVSLLKDKSQDFADLITYGFWDIKNNRQYLDWYPQYLVSELPSLVSKHGERAIWNQKWVLDSKETLFQYSKDTVVCTGTSVVSSRKLLADTSLVAKFASWQKGARGYDYYLCNNLGTNRKHFFPTYVNHLGVFAPQLDGKLWTHMESEISNNIVSNLPHDQI